MPDPAIPRIDLHCPVLDADHEVLFGMIHRCQTGIAEKRGPAALNRLVLELSAYVDAHFESEAELMEQHSFPGAEAHIAEHNWMRQRVQELCDSMQAADTTKANDILVFLREWIQDHIASTDRLLAEHLLASGAAMETESEGVF